MKPKFKLHDGGNCPVAYGTIVDVLHRSGEISEKQQAWGYNRKEGFSPDSRSLAGCAFWRNDGAEMDIIAYRICE